MTVVLETSAAPLTELQVAAYDIGDRSVEDIFAPVDMAVTDYQRTDKLRQEASQKVASIFRYDSAVAIEAEKNLRESFAFAKMRFSEALLMAAKRPRLSPQTLNHPSYKEFVQWFETQYPDFPMTPSLARAWALQESDEAVLTSWVGYLRQAMNQCVHPDLLPPEMGFGPAHVRMVPMGISEDALTVKDVENQGVNVMRSNMVALAESKALLRKAVGSSSPQLGNYLANYVVGNCFPEEKLTRSLREKEVADLWAVDRYNEGDLIVGQGKLVTPRAKAALDALLTEQMNLADAETSFEPEEQPMNAWNRLVASPGRLESLAGTGLWLLAGVSLVGMMMVAWMVRRKRLRKQTAIPEHFGEEEAYTVIMNPDNKETIFLPSKQRPESTQTENAGEVAVNEVKPEVADPEMVGEVSKMKTGCPDHGQEEAWMKRAHDAERRADKIFRMVRAGLAPQLARQMMSRLVQELMSQRADWIQTQEVVEHDIIQIEKRFVKSHEQLQERLKAFEKRADELEKALELKAEENSELIKAHIALAQEKLKSVKDEQKTELPIWN